MSAEMSLEEMRARNALMRSARPVQCKTGLAIARGRNRRKVVHHPEWITAACTDGRLHYFAGWICGDCSWDAIIVADTGPYDMCKRCEAIAQGPFVYRCYDAAGRLLYIGSATSRVSRFQGHRKTSPWWPEVTDVKLTDQPDIETARQAEAAAIEAEAPIHNKKHNKQRVQRVGAQWQSASEAA